MGDADACGRVAGGGVTIVVVWRGGGGPTLFRWEWRLDKLTLFTDYDSTGTQQPMQLTRAYAL